MQMWECETENATGNKRPRHKQKKLHRVGKEKERITKATKKTNRIDIQRIVVDEVENFVARSRERHTQFSRCWDGRSNFFFYFKWEKKILYAQTNSETARHAFDMEKRCNSHGATWIFASTVVAVASGYVPMLSLSHCRCSCCCSIIITFLTRSTNTEDTFGEARMRVSGMKSHAGSRALCIVRFVCSLASQFACLCAWGTMWMEHIKRWKHGTSARQILLDAREQCTEYSAGEPLSVDCANVSSAFSANMELLGLESIENGCDVIAAAAPFTRSYAAWLLQNVCVLVRCIVDEVVATALLPHHVHGTLTHSHIHACTHTQTVTLTMPMWWEFIASRMPNNQNQCHECKANAYTALWRCAMYTVGALACMANMMMIELRQTHRMALVLFLDAQRCRSASTSHPRVRSCVSVRERVYICKCMEEHHKHRHTQHPSTEPRDMRWKAMLSDAFDCRLRDALQCIQNVGEIGELR